MGFHRVHHGFCDPQAFTHTAVRKAVGCPDTICKVWNCRCIQYIDPLFHIFDPDCTGMSLPDCECRGFFGQCCKCLLLEQQICVHKRGRSGTRLVAGIF